MGRRKAGFLEKFLYKVGLKTANHTFTDEDRANALLIRQKRAQKNLLKEDVEIAKLKKEAILANNKSMDEIVMEIVQNFASSFTNNMISGSVPSAASPAQPNVNNSQKSLSMYEEIDESTIREKVSELDASQLAYLKGQSDETLTKLGKEHLGLSGSNMEKAIKVIRHG